VKIVLDSKALTVRKEKLRAECQTFQQSPERLDSPDQVRSRVCIEVLRSFISAIEGTAPNITKENVSRLSLLCREFGFRDLFSRISAFRTQCPSTEDNIHQQINDLEGRLFEQERDLKLMLSPYAHVEVVKQDVEYVGPDLADIRGHLERIRGNVESIGGDVKHIRGDVKRMGGDVKGIRDDATDVCGDVAGIRGDVQCIRGETVDDKGRIYGIVAAIRQLQVLFVILFSGIVLLAAVYLPQFSALKQEVTELQAAQKSIASTSLELPNSGATMH
jgi:hypothetical protein